MKKFFKSSIFMMLFALAFVVAGANRVSALEASINNTNVISPELTFQSMEEDYYVVNDSNESANIKLKAKTRNAGVDAAFPRYYLGEISIVKCNTFLDGVCTVWDVYDYTPQTKNKGAVTMDNLLDGVTFDLKNVEFAQKKGETKVLNKELGELTSIYGLTNTHFVLVSYTRDGLLKDTTYETEVYRFVLTSSLTSISVDKENTSTGVRIKVSSGTPITSVKYFASETTLEAGFDFASKYEENGGITQLSSAASNPVSVNGVFTYEFDIVTQEGKSYYFEIEDLAKNKLTYDMTADKQDVNTPGTTPDDPSDNVGDTNVGKIILIALVVILIISIVLVIVQKIFDHKRKLY